jgi:hypothetical protein
MGHVKSLSIILAAIFLKMTSSAEQRQKRVFFLIFSFVQETFFDADFCHRLVIEYNHVYSELAVCLRL